MAPDRGQELLSDVEIDSADAVTRAALARAQEDDDAEIGARTHRLNPRRRDHSIPDLDAIVGQVLDDAPRSRTALPLIDRRRDSAFDSAGESLDELPLCE